MYDHGNWKAICDRCGFEYLASKLDREWTGLRTCHGSGTNGCWEPRHPQDHVRGKVDKQTPSWVRPEGPDVFITPGPIDWDDL